MQSRLSRVLASFFVLLLSAACNESARPRATSSVFGKVTVKDAADNGGVRVSIEEHLAATDSTGKFDLQNLGAGEHTMRVALEGYVTDEQKFSLEPGERKELNVTLERVNKPPTITSITASPSQLRSDAASVIEVSAIDEDGDALSYAFSADNGFTVAQDAAQPNHASATAPSTRDTRGTLTVTVTDARGASSTGKIVLSTLPNTLPSVTAVVATPSTSVPGGTVNITAFAVDGDSDPLSYEWTLPAGWTGSSTTEAIVVTAPTAFSSSAVVEVKVTDDRGGSVTGKVAVATGQNVPPQITSITAAPPQTRPLGTIVLSASAFDPDGLPLTYAWTAPQGWTLTGAADGGTLAGPDVRLTAPDQYGASGDVTLTVTDSANLSVTAKLVVSTTMGGAPVISSLSAAPSVLAKNATATVLASVNDPDGDPISYTWIAPSGWTITAAADGGAPNSATITVTAPNLPNDTATITLTATDGRGGSSTGSVFVSTEANHAPEVTTVTANPAAAQAAGTISLFASARDPDGDPLTYSWSVDSTAWTFTGSPSGPTASITGPPTYSATALVTVVITDVWGLSVTASTVVAINPDRAPAFTTNPPTTYPIAGRPIWAYTAAARDPDGDPLLFRVGSGAPSWATVVGDTLFMRPPRSATGASYSFDFEVASGTLSAAQRLTGNVQPFSLRPFPAGSRGFAQDEDVADLNGDGKTDIFAETTAGDVNVWFATASGFSGVLTLPDTDDMVANCWTVGAGDVNGDGDVDIVVPCAQSRASVGGPLDQTWTLMTYLNNGNGTFTRAPIQQQMANGGVNGANFIALGDLNADGRDDVALAAGQRVLQTYTANPTGGFTFRSAYTTPTSIDIIYSTVTIGETTGGGGPDISFPVFTNNNSPPQTSSLYTVPTDGTGVLLPSQLQSTPPVANAQYAANARADFDGDGDLDMVLWDFTGKVQLFKNTPPAGLTNVGNVVTPYLSYRRSLVTADFDGDGKMDFAAYNSSDATNSVIFFGDGALNFPGSAVVAAGTTASGSVVFTGDWDGDGVPDLYWINSSNTMGVSY